MNKGAIRRPLPRRPDFWRNGLFGCVPVLSRGAEAGPEHLFPFRFQRHRSLGVMKEGGD